MRVRYLLVLRSLGVSLFLSLSPPWFLVSLRESLAGSRNLAFLLVSSISPGPRKLADLNERPLLHFRPTRSPPHTRGQGEEKNPPLLRRKRAWLCFSVTVDIKESSSRHSKFLRVFRILFSTATNARLIRRWNYRNSNSACFCKIFIEKGTC